MGSPEVLDVLELRIADAPVKVEAVAHGVCRFLGSVDELVDERGINVWSCCVVDGGRGKGLKRPREVAFAPACRPERKGGDCVRP